MMVMMVMMVMMMMMMMMMIRFSCNLIYINSSIKLKCIRLIP